jgi:hypothetical protein
VVNDHSDKHVHWTYCEVGGVGEWGGRNVANMGWGLSKGGIAALC